MIYRVKRLMMYDGVQLERGAIWTPGGHANDAAIIRSGMVYKEEEAPPEPESPTPAPDSVRRGKPQREV